MYILLWAHCYLLPVQIGQLFGQILVTFGIFILATCLQKTAVFLKVMNGEHIVVCVLIINYLNLNQKKMVVYSALMLNIRNFTQKIGLLIIFVFFFFSQCERASYC